MEPVTAIGLAASVLQIVDYGTRLFMTGYQTYKSTKGETDENAHIEKLTADLQSIAGRLERDASGISGSPSDDDLTLLALARQSKGVAQELLDILEKVKRKGKSKTWGAVQAAMRVTWNKEEIRDKFKQLKEIQSLVNTTLMNLLRSDLSKLGPAINNLNISSSTRHSENSKQLETMRLDILLAVREDGKRLTDAFNQLSLDEASANFAAERRCENSLAKLTDLIENYATQAGSFDKAEKILSSLLFSAMEDRRSNISEPKGGTFGWIFGENGMENDDDDEDTGSYSDLEEESNNTDDSNTDDPNKNDNAEQSGLSEDEERTKAELAHRAEVSELFQTWLRVENGVFYISGKAGSGKSTLMNYIAGHQKTGELLAEWAESHKRLLTRASFFFWNAGTDLQRTHEGLLRSLLFQILNQCRDLIPTAMPERWRADKFILSHPEAHPWTLRELSDAIKRVTESASTGNGCFCFFIDGLDEYQGEHRLLVKDIRRLCTSSFVKICVSSRPWNIFEHAFGQGSQTRKLCLHEYTKSDIHKFVQSQLAEDDTFKELVHSHDQAHKLIDRIENQADGVFLWVVLVVRELHAELGELGSFEDLEDKLDSLPPDLDSFFKHIWDGIEKPYKRYMARLLLLCLNDEEIPLIFVHFLYEHTKSPGCHLGRTPIPISPETRDTWVQQARRKVNKWCRDLVEVPATERPRDSLDAVVEFTHRSVKDYLQQERVLQDLYTHAGVDFEPHFTAFELQLSFLKCLDNRTAMSSDGSTENNPFFTRVAEHAMSNIHSSVWETARWARMLSELDKACTDIWVRNEGGPFHWTSSCLKTVMDAVFAPHSTFLMYVIQHGCGRAYTQEKIAEMSDEDCRTQGPYLLFSSLYHTYNLDWMHYEVRTVRKELLLRGVSVNAKVELIRPICEETDVPQLITRTIWETFLIPTDTIMWEGDYVDTVRLLLEAGADVHCALPEGFTCLGSCLVMGHIRYRFYGDAEDTKMLMETLGSFGISVDWSQVATRSDGPIGSWDELARYM